MKHVLYLSILLGIACSVPPSDAMAKTPDGREVFDRNCSVCHPINPPPKSAPPVASLSSRYHEKFATKAQGVAHMEVFLKKPDKSKVIDSRAIARFGLMPVITMTDAERTAVASWFWDQYDPEMRRGRGMGGGQRRLMNQ
ncbi:MAG: cytochrome c [Chlorobiaceae bacterium]|jgi:cytochrome c|nr:cytochrome c [Chlorobiaceae bacterium]